MVRPSSPLRAIIIILGTFVGWILRISAALAPLVPTPQQNNGLLILGLGRVGMEVARQSTSTSTGMMFDTITGTVRGAATAAEKPAPPVRTVSFQDTASILETAESGCISHLLVTVPPAKDVIDQLLLDEVLDSVTERLPAHCWIGVLSTTGVYGNHNGAWVTEESPCLATSRLYLDYEEQWKIRAQHGNNHTLYLFRCAGIYGANQSALHTVFRKGMPLAEQVTDTTTLLDVTNRIHMHDLAAAVVASMNRHSHDGVNKSCCNIYNLADNLPESRTIVMAYAQHLLESIGATVPEAQQAQSNKNGRSARRRTDQKRVCNRKMKNELLLGATLKYPTYKEGLAAILHDRANPWWCT